MKINPIDKTLSKLASYNKLPIKNKGVKNHGAWTQGQSGFNYVSQSRNWGRWKFYDMNKTNN